MRTQPYIYLLSLFFLVAAAEATASAVDDLQGIYFLVLEQMMQQNPPPTGLVSVAMAEQARMTREEGFIREYVSVPKYLCERLESEWQNGGLDLRRLIPAERIENPYRQKSLFDRWFNKDNPLEQLGLRDKITGGEVWLYRIDSLSWLGGDNVIVDWEVRFGAGIPRYGDIGLRKVDGKWEIAVDAPTPDSDAATKHGSMTEDLEEIFFLVFSRVVGKHPQPRRVSVALARIPDSHDFLPLPKNLYKRLEAVWVAKNYDLQQFIPADQIQSRSSPTGALKEKETGREVWLYRIELCWQGGSAVFVRWSVYHGALAAGGSTFMLRKVDGKWLIIKEMDNWVS